MATHLVWFRNDLRMSDNLALHAACQDKKARVIGLFIATPRQWANHDMSERQAALMFDNLQRLQQSLHDKGIPLFYQQCGDFNDSVDALVEFCQREQVTNLFYNYQYELNERQRDRKMEQALDGKVVCQGFDDSLLLPPGSVMTGDGKMYRVFTPFSKAFVKRLQQSETVCVPAPTARGKMTDDVPPVKPFDYPSISVSEDFPAGEEAAQQRLRQFCRQKADGYASQRDLPGAPGTSQLSPYLALGVISPRQCLEALLAEYPEALRQPDSSAFVWFNELIWREFYRHLMVFSPELCRHQPFIPWTKQVEWRDDPKGLKAWQEGRTGFPIVDAGMRQLNHMGWMHNRLRMICASFLIKDLLIDWREGERYFMSQLVDGDLAANNGGWQWAASTGTDSAPYFRIFNPSTQGERFDPDGDFIRRWVPELSKVPGKAIHHPLRWAEQQGQKLDYPAPIVDHKQARTRTLAAFESAKNTQ
ncbi:deoxyribodipyrimidine photo-lyase [Lonsdalea quercina]|uniref:deoxyribodipyrimidine photo-lyase n=1 Tax=Lonsdalea quercina TaxID=71657 RepID=UPI0039748904